MEKFYQTESDPKQLSPLTLAYVGDGVYELFVREYIVSKGNCPVKSCTAAPFRSCVASFRRRCLVKC